MKLPEGFVAVVKRDCPTCVLVEPVLQEIARGGLPLTVYTQDDPSFPKLDRVLDDTSLERSFRLDIETVPTLIQVENGEERSRVIGWAREEWTALTGLENIGMDLPPNRPGCGSLSVEPANAEKLALRFGDISIHSRRIAIPEMEDDIEYCFERGWSDGLPLVPPTEERVYRMLQGARRRSDELLGEVPPVLVSLTIEKVAVNAVMAGCKPEYLPVVIAATEAALDPAFCMHGLLATTWFSGPLVVVNGPVRKSIGMNWQGNVLGQGNRANATIGRALQLIIRNVGGGRPQEADQSTFGTPGKYTFCFAEDEDTPWLSLSEERGFGTDQSTVTLFSADGVQGVLDQKARAPEPLIKSIAQSLRTVGHADLVNGSDAVVVIGPEHGRVFDEAGWSKIQAVEALHAQLGVRGDDLAMGTDEDAPRTTASAGGMMPKFRPEGLTLIRAGGRAGLFSAIIPGWLMKGPLGTDPVTKEILS
ncbi:MAG: thioredoxin family protein [Pseudomonadota bacterium]|nr:thioredoxin family protein [Pseudomonadota bacterium]